MARIRLSHSSADSDQPAALKRSFPQRRPGLANGIFLGVDRGRLFTTSCRAADLDARLRDDTIAGADTLRRWQCRGTFTGT